MEEFYGISAVLLGMAPDFKSGHFYRRMNLALGQIFLMF